MRCSETSGAVALDQHAAQDFSIKVPDTSAANAVNAKSAKRIDRSFIENSLQAL